MANDTQRMALRNERPAAPTTRMMLRMAALRRGSAASGQAMHRNGHALFAARAMSSSFRSHTCGDLRDSDHAGQRVTLSGWVDAIRAFGPISFVSLRDRYGVTQLVLQTDTLSTETATALRSLRPESVVQASGVVRARPEDMRNASMATGAVEVLVDELQCLNTCESLPIQVCAGAELANEDTRLRHRYLDLRRPELQQNLVLRSQVALATRNFLCEQGFVEIETPTLFKSTPEGAREFLVPTRQRGQFYALTQSPQQYKQLLMVGGLDRYFQLARCYRDEGGRADRQPEFTQIDVEMSFVVQEDVMAVMEQLIRRIWKQAGHALPDTAFRRMRFQEAMHRFGVDKPDTRYGLELQDMAHVVRGATFGPFQQALALPSGKGTVRAINAKSLAVKGFSRKEMDELERMGKRQARRGVSLFTVKVEHDGGAWKSSMAKHLSVDQVQAVNDTLQVEGGDVLLFAAGEYDGVTELLGRMRSHCAQLLRGKGFLEKELSPTNFHHLWVVDFPMFELNEDGARAGDAIRPASLSATHHPFTAPTATSAGLLAEVLAQQTEVTASGKSSGSGSTLLCDPETVNKLLELRAQHYDIVCNGWELGGGSIRLHNADVQQAVFEEILDLPALQRESFEHLLQALRHGAPPHGGIALGLDRLVAILAGAPSLRDVIAFPKSATGNELMTLAPGPVLPAQLEEYHIQVAPLVEDKAAAQD